MAEQSSGFEARAARFDGRRTRAVEADPHTVALPNGGLTWVHVVTSDRAEGAAFLEQFCFHPLAIEDALSENERPTVRRYGEATFFSAAAVIQATDEELYHEVGFFALPNLIVTVVNAPCPCVAHLFERWMAEPKRLGKNPAFLVHSILDAIVDDYFPAADRLEDEIDQLEERVYVGQAEALTEALDLKRRLLRLRRRTSAIRDVLNGMLRGDWPELSSDARPYYQDVYDHALRITENADLNRDILSTILDIHLSLISNNLNDIMKKMAAIATVLMSVSFLAGIWGMNFEFMPELRWPGGYLFALGLMLVVVLAELFGFRRIGWL